MVVACSDRPTVGCLARAVLQGRYCVFDDCMGWCPCRLWARLASDRCHEEATGFRSRGTTRPYLLSRMWTQPAARGRWTGRIDKEPLGRPGNKANLGGHIGHLQPGARGGTAAPSVEIFSGARTLDPAPGLDRNPLLCRIVLPDDMPSWQRNCRQLRWGRKSAATPSRVRKRVDFFADFPPPPLHLLYCCLKSK
jgi:hypothetical protein